MFHSNLTRYAERIPRIERKLDFLHEARAWFNVDEAWRARFELAKRITHTSKLVSDPNWFEACGLDPQRTFICSCGPRFIRNDSHASDQSAISTSSIPSLSTAVCSALSFRRARCITNSWPMDRTRKKSSFWDLVCIYN